ncbi:hypothetical protein [Actinobaculum suis]|nr:hypothetical protein [Actinobaculum suis]
MEHKKHGPLRAIALATTIIAALLAAATAITLHTRPKPIEPIPTNYTPEQQALVTAAGTHLIGAPGKRLDGIAGMACLYQQQADIYEDLATLLPNYTPRKTTTPAESIIDNINRWENTRFELLTGYKYKDFPARKRNAIPKITRTEAESLFEIIDAQYDCDAYIEKLDQTK